MSSATENNGEVAVEKVAADATAPAVKEDKQITKSAPEETAASDNGTTKPAVTKDQVKGTKRPADDKTAASKKAKQDSAANASDCSDDEEEIIEEEILGEIESDIESDEYDLPYGEEDDEENDVSGSDDQA